MTSIGNCACDKRSQHAVCDDRYLDTPLYAPSRATLALEQASRPQVIPAEAVEAAAKVAYEEAGGYATIVSGLGSPWADADPETKSRWHRTARAALEAAAPYMQTATDDALRAAWDRGYATSTDGVKDVLAQAWDRGNRAALGRPNPYRKGQ